MGLEIRRAETTDAPAIASIHVRCWQHAYRDIVPDAVLDSLSVTAHEQLWRHSLETREEALQVWIASEHGRAVGFCATGLSSDEDATPDTAEVGAIYLEPDRIAAGLGRALFEHGINDLRDRGFLTATLWVFRDNLRARRFYEIAGWRPDAERTRPRGEVPVAEVRYRAQLRIGKGR